MAGRIPDETLQAIRERVSIVEVVSGYVTLKKAGRNHLGLCPFHAEKTPSFTVSDERGLFHCFGCGAGGTAFNFVMRADHISFPEAVEMLAQRAGVALPKHNDAPGGDQRQHLFEVNEHAQRCFRAGLRSAGGAAARQYLVRRGVTAAIVERYGLGFCPPDGSGLVGAVSARRLAAAPALELGLIARRSSGGFYDRFWGRITFPIRDGSGRIVGFGGRTLGASHPKYLNSPESPLFHKGKVLYGLYEARQAVREAGRIVIVEGYLDALALVEAGIAPVVAGLGTALGVEQLRLARRFAPQVVVFFDGDRAGQEAAVRAFTVCAETGVWGLGAFLPQGVDPDTFVRTQGAVATGALLDGAVPLADFFLTRLDPGPGASVPERRRAAERIGGVLARIQDPIQFDMLAKQAAQRLDIEESVFRQAALARTASESVRRDREVVPEARPAEAFRREEEMLIETMVLDHSAARLVSDSGALELFRSAELGRVGRTIIDAWEAHGEANGVIDRLPAAVAQRVTANLVGQGPMAASDRMQVARDCLARIEEHARQLGRKEQRARLRQAEASGDGAAYSEHLKRANDLRRREQGECG